ncbi:hypothetical protein DESC_870090 [Desulfosarcina cetonica]|uniref:hypothetical protein n=1 Tax=Desulfosarcina cetonica TaxID=90730 RepID=UPI0012EE9635|nr:hypothetical protein [Desulfosarcina cetonica]VTR70934.1 hypothetical protein DESC_870090 [Desulfosarcina cetonica]
MENKMPNNKGIQLLAKRCRDQFQRRENTDYYSPDDYHSAERNYVKFCVFSETGVN